MMASDLRPHLATVADGLDELVPALYDLAEATASAAEREAFAQAARGAIRMAKQLRALTHFVGHRSGRSGDTPNHGSPGSDPESSSLRAPRGSDPRARAASPDRTRWDHGRIG